MLKLGAFTIELVKPVDASRVRTLAGPVQHISLCVPSLDEAISGLKAKAVQLSTEGIEVLPDFLSGVRHCFIAGPSGERIEICEMLPVRD